MKKSVTAEITEDQDFSNSNVWFKKCHSCLVHCTCRAANRWVWHSYRSYNKRNKTQTHI